MGIAALIIGKSGSGKSASLRNFKPSEVGIINVMGKPLPFKSELKPFNTADYSRVTMAISAPNAKVSSFVIDDAGYLITHEFMTRHSNVGGGNAVFALYNEMADKFYSLVRSVLDMPADKIVYFMMHEEKNDFGDIKPKTIGKLLDEKVCLEGLFTIVLRCMTNGQGQHVFTTQTSGLDVAKSPMGLFTDMEIDNDLKAVDTAIREYYNIKQGKRRMRKINDFGNVPENQGGEYEKLPAGGYICKIKSVEDVPGKEYLKIEFDIADGKHRGWFSEIYKRANFWGGNFIRSYKESAAGFFKGFITAIENSNAGYKWEWAEQSLVGKNIGLVLAYEEYVNKSNVKKERIYVAQNRSVDAIRKGDFVVPELKKLNLKITQKNEPDNSFDDAAETGEKMPWDE